MWLTLSAGKRGNFNALFEFSVILQAFVAAGLCYGWIPAPCRRWAGDLGVFLGRDELPGPLSHVLGTGGGDTDTGGKGSPAPCAISPAPCAASSAPRAHPQRHCGGRGFLPYMVMAALAAAALIGGGGGAARQVRGN